MSKDNLSPYKGVRDFYPEDMARQKHIFDVWRRVCERFGYEEYNASILEPTDLYRAKTSEEIVNEQTYSFTDRGGRDITLRPEMTPTVSRMVAARRRELALPLRWFSIPNVFRYERPQRGRLREHWQLNADIFGVEGIEADVEIITLAYNIMKEFGAQDSDFEIRINSRAALREILKARGIAPENIEEELSHADKGKSSIEISGTPESVKNVLDALSSRGIINVQFEPTLVRGFSYYTGTVFEVFDTNPENNRSLFGGGRYDNLVGTLDADDSIPAVGFGMGDVTIADFLDVRNLMPEYVSSTRVLVCVVDEKGTTDAQTVVSTLRENGIATALYLGSKKVGDQIAIANKKHIPYVICVGEKEATEKSYTLKELKTGAETTGDISTIARGVARL